MIDSWHPLYTPHRCQSRYYLPGLGLGPEPQVEPEPEPQVEPEPEPETETETEKRHSCPHCILRMHSGRRL